MNPSPPQADPSNPLVLNYKTRDRPKHALLCLAASFLPFSLLIVASMVTNKASIRFLWDNATRAFTPIFGSAAPTAAYLSVFAAPGAIGLLLACIGIRQIRTRRTLWRIARALFWLSLAINVGAPAIAFLALLVMQL